MPFPTTENSQVVTVLVSHDHVVLREATGLERTAPLRESVLPTSRSHSLHSPSLTRVRKSYTGIVRSQQVVRRRHADCYCPRRPARKGILDLHVLMWFISLVHTNCFEWVHPCSRKHGPSVRSARLDTSNIISYYYGVEKTHIHTHLHHTHPQSADGSFVGLGAAVPHAVDGDSLVYEATATTNTTVEGIAVQESTMTTSVLSQEASVTVRQQGQRCLFPCLKLPSGGCCRGNLLERTYVGHCRPTSRRFPA